MDARTKAERAREDYWIVRLEDARERLLFAQEQRAQFRSKRTNQRSGLPGPWFDVSVIVLTIILGITCLIQGWL